MLAIPVVGNRVPEGVGWERAVERGVPVWQVMQNPAAISDLSLVGVTMPWSCIRSRSIFTCLLVRPEPESDFCVFAFPPAVASAGEPTISCTTVASADGSSVRVDAGASETSSTGGLRVKAAPPSPSFAAAFSTDDRPLPDVSALSRSL